LHDTFGLYKTAAEIEAEKQRILNIKREKERLIREAKLKAKRERKQRIRDFFHSYFGLFKTRAEINFEETLNTLKYAFRARNI